MTPPSSPPYPDVVSDADTFHALVKSHAPMVFATARRVTGNAALAEDVAQETFLELSLQSHGAMGSVSAWLHRVAWRKACNVVRSESRRRHHEQAAAEASCATEDAVWQELEPLIDNALKELPSPLKELLVEHYLQGRTQQELASSRGLSQSTISRQLDAGLHALRARLRSQGALCGVGLASLLGAHSAEAAPASLQVSLGKLALSGVGTSASGVPASIPIATSLFAMSLRQDHLLQRRRRRIDRPSPCLHSQDGLQPRASETLRFPVIGNRPIQTTRSHQGQRTRRRAPALPSPTRHRSRAAQG